MPLVDGKLIGKYRALLIDHTDLPREAERLAPQLETVAEKHNSEVLSEAEFARAFVQLFATSRSGPMRGGQFRGMPGMIFSILDDWQRGAARLRLTRNSVSAQTMLRAQAEGWRYVTIDIAAALAGSTVEKTRDAFEFALHDLGHAYAFFKPAYDHLGQADFFSSLVSDLRHLEDLCGADAKFAADLEYVMADMNSHPQHLREYLRGVIVESHLRLEKSETALAELLANLSSLTGLESVAVGTR